LWTDKTKQFSKQRHCNCLRATKVRVWCISVFLKTESSHDKQACTTVVASTEVQYWHRMDWRQKTITAHNTTWTFSSLKIVKHWKHRTHPSFCIYPRPESTAPQLSESSNGESWIAWQTNMYYRNCQYWNTVLAQDGLTTEKNNSTQRNMNLFFLQNCSKMKTQDSPLVLYLPPTKMNIGNDFGHNEVQNEKDSQCSIHGRWLRDCINSVRSSLQKLRANPSGYHSTMYKYKYMIAESTWKLYGAQVEVP
jgi:hypothetical protein